MMTNRFKSAIDKLYNAYHNKTLNPECCIQCAVGNILDNKDYWKHLSDKHGSLTLSYVGRVHQAFGRKFNGYTPLELLEIEKVFLEACGFKVPLHYKNEKPVNFLEMDRLFKGLEAVVEFLCRLDGIPNVMDYKRLFEVERDRTLLRETA